MATNLRDLDADRQFLNGLINRDFWTQEQTDITNIADAALDEIDRLKRLLILHSGDKFLIHDGHSFIGEVKSFDNESDAWAAVRKSAGSGQVPRNSETDRRPLWNALDDVGDTVKERMTGDA